MSISKDTDPLVRLTELSAELFHPARLVVAPYNREKLSEELNFGLDRRMPAVVIDDGRRDEQTSTATTREREKAAR